MKVVFFQDVEGTAQVGEVKEVKNGFARNFLLPRGLAGGTTKHNLQHANALAEKEARRQEKLDADARTTTGLVEGRTVTIEARVGETGRLFGSVTNRDIADQLNSDTGLSIDPHIILLPEPIREIGQRHVTVKFTRNVAVDITVDVVPDEASRPAVEKLLAEQAAAAAAEAKAAADAAYEAEAQPQRRQRTTSADDNGPAGEADAANTGSEE